ncbi:MAG: pyridoxal phosphate-dependent aminotransferase [Desulfofustis sp.]|nr:pyridoxal phosphate-dependent aminotransferase [Desulfofustis sp.]NNF48116.1 pyridoxal phosphate-dependent aminotransferase [Desulfofustis sp.]
MYDAERMSRVPFSGIRKVFEEVHRRQAQGQNIVNLGIGRPDFDTPENIKEAAKKALDEGHVHYASNYGIDQLRSAIANKFKRDNGLEFDPDGEIMVTVGANEAVFLTMIAFIDNGDEVLIPDPCWPHYSPCVDLAGGVPVALPVYESNGFNPVKEDILAHCSKKTKLIVVNSPQNPTGAVYSQDTLQEIARLAIEKDWLVLSDEIYEHLIYGGEQHYSMAGFPGMRPRTITVNGFSKSYAMTGWRLGYVGVDRSLMSALVRAHQYSTNCVSTFSQYGATEALNGPQAALHNMVQEFSLRRDLVADRLSSMPHVSFSEPKGAFYVMVNVSGTGKETEQVAKELLDAGVAVVPGTKMGTYGGDFIRLSYANSYENLEVAMTRMKSYFESI